MNRWIHCNAYKRPEMPAFMALFHFHTCHNLENLLIKPDYKVLAPELNLAAVPTSKKVFVCPIRTLLGRFRVHGFIDGNW